MIADIYLAAVYLTILAAEILAIGYLISYRPWRRWDHERRSNRLVRRNLQRMTGGPR